MKIYLLQRVCQVRTCLTFLILSKLKGNLRVLLKKKTDGKEITENINDRNVTVGSVEDPLNMHRTASNETILISEIPNIINEENVTIAPRQRKKTISILSDKFCEKQAFLYLLPTGKFGYNASQDIAISTGL